jgi:hypothetical protein
MILDPHMLARALGGEVSGGEVRCPGPGHTAKDRSLCIKLDPNAPNGYICFSHAGDDINECRDHINQKAGLPAFGSNGHNNDTQSRFDWRQPRAAAPQPAPQAAPKRTRPLPTPEIMGRAALAAATGGQPEQQDAGTATIHVYNTSR